METLGAEEVACDGVRVLSGSARDRAVCLPQCVTVKSVTLSMQMTQSNALSRT